MGCLKLEILKDYKPTLRVVGKNPETEKKCVNCYPFGAPMPGRTFNSSEYRFGFNGMEKDDEIKGSGNHYTTEFRQYDPRLGRWFSIDPLFSDFPWQSPYVAFDNNPVLLNDPKGLSAEGDPEDEENGYDFEVTTNDPKTPDGPYLRVGLTVEAGPHSKEGVRLFGIGEKLEVGVSVEIANAEILVGLEESYINFEIFNSSDANIVVGGTEVLAGGKVTVSKSLETGELTGGSGEIHMGPIALGVATDKDVPLMSVSIFDASRTVIGGGVPYSVTFSASIENIEFNNLQKGDAATGYSLSYRQSYGWAQTQIYRLREQALERKKQALINRLNGLKE